MDTEDKKQDEYFMRLAYQEAVKAFDIGEVPIGAILVKEQKVIAKAHNQVEILQDATAHAEILCITSAMAFFHQWRLLGCTLYCTLEPCTMCIGALINSRLQRLVWGAPDHRVGACGSWMNVFTQKHPIHELSMTSHVLQEPCGQILQDFFQTKRKHGSKNQKTF